MGRELRLENSDDGPDEDEPEEQADGKRDRCALNERRIERAAMPSGLNRIGPDSVRMVGSESVQAQPPSERSARLWRRYGKVRAARGPREA